MDSLLVAAVLLALFATGFLAFRLLYKRSHAFFLLCLAAESAWKMRRGRAKSPRRMSAAARRSCLAVGYSFEA